MRYYSLLLLAVAGCIAESACPTIPPEPKYRFIPVNEYYDLGDSILAFLKDKPMTRIELTGGDKDEPGGPFEKLLGMAFHLGTNGKGHTVNGVLNDLLHIYLKFPESDGGKVALTIIKDYYDTDVLYIIEVEEKGYYQIWTEDRLMDVVSGHSFFVSPSQPEEKKYGYAVPYKDGRSIAIYPFFCSTLRKVQ